MMRPLPTYIATCEIASPGSANIIRSPGRRARKSAATPLPARTCSRAVRGSVMPYFANTYFVKPEQSNPLGVLPPQTYGTPTYASAVCRTREAAVDGGGDSGMRLRLPDGDGIRPPLDVVVVDDGMLAMTADRMSVGDTPSVVADVQPARESTETAAIAPARACEGVTMSRGKASSKPRCIARATR